MYTASWTAPLKAGVHSAQHWYYMAEKVSLSRFFMGKRGEDGGRGKMKERGLHGRPQQRRCYRHVVAESGRGSRCIRGTAYYSRWYGVLLTGVRHLLTGACDGQPYCGRRPTLSWTRLWRIRISKLTRVAHQGDITVDQAHRGYDSTYDETGKAWYNPF